MIPIDCKITNFSLYLSIISSSWAAKGGEGACNWVPSQSKLHNSIWIELPAVARRWFQITRLWFPYMETSWLWIWIVMAPGNLCKFSCSFAALRLMSSCYYYYVVASCYLIWLYCGKGSLKWAAHLHINFQCVSLCMVCLIEAKTLDYLLWKGLIKAHSFIYIGLFNYSNRTHTLDNTLFYSKLLSSPGH